MKLSLIFSDIEAGAGTVTDDFIEEELLCNTIKKHFEESNKQSSDIILNGDTFDFMKCPYRKTYPKYITEKVSLAKLNNIHKAHKPFFETLKGWINLNETNRIIFIYGNHDFDLAFPKVQTKLKNIIAGKNKEKRKKIIFPGFEYKEHKIFVEHGSQMDEFFYVDPKKFIYHSKKHSIKEPFLLLPWGYNALYDHYIFQKEKYPLLEKILPRGLVLGHLPLKLKKVFIVDTFNYLIKSFFYTQLKHWKDPLHRFPPKEFFKYIRKFAKNNYNLEFTDEAEKKLSKSKFKIISVGHSHKSYIKKIKNKKIINTGCWRDEYKIGKDNQTFVPKIKSYAYILHEKNKVYKSKLIKVRSKQKKVTLEFLKKEMNRGEILS